MSIDLLTIGELGSKDFLKVNKNDSLHNVIREMEKEGVDRALVYSDDKAEGIITKKDIVSRIAMTKRKRFPVSSLHVSSVMTYPLIVLPHDTLVPKAARVMLEKGISSVPAEESGNITALFSKWELARAMIKDPTPLEEVMSRNVVKVYETDSMILARKLMIEEGLSTLPVMNSEGRVVGILTLSELMDTLVELLDVLAETGARDALRRVSVGEIMRPLIPALKPTDAVGMAAALMLEKEIRGILVVSEGGEVEGIVTLTDLTKHVVSKW